MKTVKEMKAMKVFKEKDFPSNSFNTFIFFTVFMLSFWISVSAGESRPAYDYARSRPSASR